MPGGDCPAIEVSKELWQLFRALLLSVAKGFLGFAAAYRFVVQKDPDVPAALFFSILGLVVLVLDGLKEWHAHWKDYYQRIEKAIAEALRQSTEPIDCMLNTLHSILVGQRQGQEHGLRICLCEHRDGLLYQMTEYAGTEVRACLLIHDS